MAYAFVRKPMEVNQLYETTRSAQEPMPSLQRCSPSVNDELVVHVGEIVFPGGLVRRVPRDEVVLVKAAHEPRSLHRRKVPYAGEHLADEADVPPQRPAP